MDDIRNISERRREQISQLCLMDDIYMTLYFADNIPCTELILRIIMEKPDLMVKSVQVQRVLKNPQGRSVRLDVTAVDGEGVEYDIEVQRDDRGAAPQRARYYASSMDANHSDVGKYFEKLPQTCVIFITENDVLGLGLPLYVIERVILGVGKSFGDGSRIVYANASIQEDTPLGRLMHDFTCSDPDEMFYDLLKERDSYLKKDEGVREVSGVMEKILAEGIEQGMARGIEQGRSEGLAQAAQRMREAARNMLTRGFSMKDTADIIGLPMEEIRALQNASKDLL